MTIYTLKFLESRDWPAREIRFEAADPGGALLLVQREPPDRPAELWDGVRKLCTLTQTMGGTWQIER
ncbi:hypothetical protein WBP06_20700 [Novosphingobium sp. BL-8H]|uniref:hypothetical protein n=1 Tax=Novosphingobium sp. BL-8H TaxID=3127640 RepID=UPI003756C993